MERLVSLILIIGAVLWFISIFFLDGRWQWQIFSAAIIITGIVAAHIWEEVFQKEEDDN